MLEKFKQFFASPKNQKATLAVAGLIIIAAAGFIFGLRPGKNAGTPEGPDTDSPATLELHPGQEGLENKKVQTTASAPTRLPRGSAPNAGTPPARPDVHDGLTFEEAVRLFGLFGYRYQFVDCRGAPGNFVLKQNTRFMLDNRDPMEHNIVVATQSFLIPGYDFAIGYAKDLGKYMMTCDGGGAASMEVVP